MHKKALFTLLICILLFFTVDTFASFGKNKVNYEQYNWKVYESKNFNLYYYPSENNIVRKAIPLIEKTIKEYKNFFSITEKLKIPIIIYHNVYKFRETNIIPYILPEGVGGFTEFSRGRVVIPFNGSLNELKHVLRHELVHSFILMKLFQIDSNNRDSNINLPLWFHEGLAEYLSVKFPREDRVYLSTVLKNDQFVPLENIGRISGTYLMYKQGQAFVAYLVEHYGMNIIQKYFDTMFLYPTFEKALSSICGKSYEQISYSYEIWLKNNFIFNSENYDNIYDSCKKIKKEIFRYYKINENKSIYITNKWGYIDIYKKTNEDSNRIFRIGNKSDYEYLSIKNMPIHNNNNNLYLGVKYKNKDIIVVFNVEKEKVEKKITTIPDIRIIYSLNFSKNNLYISGLGENDKNYLYKYNISKDQFYELIETENSINNFSVYDNKICYSSEYGVNGYKKIFLYNMVNNTIKQVTFGKCNDYYPIYNDDGNIIFLSDRDNITSLYKIKENQIFQLTKFPVYINNVWRSKNDIYFSAVMKKRTVFRLEKPINRQVVSKSKIIDNYEFPQLEKKKVKEKTKKYKPKLELDFLRANVMSSPRMGYIGDISFLFSDILDNKELFFTLGMGEPQESIDSLLKKSNYYANYTNKYHRWNYYFSLYHFYRSFNYFYEQIYDDFFNERIAGGEAGIIFPFSRFRRISAGLSFNYKEREYFIPNEWYHKLYSGINLRYVFDNTIWNNVGPIDGWRYSIQYSMDFDLNNNLDISSQYYNIDFRKYFRVLENSAFATRINYAESIGENRERDVLAMGGSLSMRGYDYYHFKGSKLFLANIEYRFLLFRNIVFGIASKNITLPKIYSSLFFDMGNCWYDNDNNNLKGSYGISFQMGLNAFVFRYDIAKKTNFDKSSSDFSYSFAIGWNY